ncbi:MAG: hypothetical protein KAU95_02715, partial [Candidatus Aenigmarchaeota archaeon]|nr:hypothetical protein [Candidatus Aenigmarchaeota archaeon]
ICGDNFNPKEQISKFAEKGEIYHKDKLVWKDGKFMEAYRAEGEDGLNDRTVPIFSLREKSAPSEGRVCSSGEEI